MVSEQINLRAVLGGRARAGFSGGTGDEYAIQDIKSWRFVN